MGIKGKQVGLDGAARFHRCRLWRDSGGCNFTKSGRGEVFRGALKKRPQDEATGAEIDQLDRERQKALELVKEINQRELLNTLTDAGLIPNYAFPEAGVELKSLLWRKRGSDDPDTAAYISLPAERYERPAQSALSEFAPENVFYANQRRVEIDQINMTLSSLESWRLCPTCQHMENLEIQADSRAACPRCGDPMWANIAQKRSLLRFRQAIANSNDTEVRIDDSAEDREPKFYVRQLLADFEPEKVVEAWRLKARDLPFGFEFIEQVQFRDINFGEPTKPGEAYNVAGQQRSRPGFKLCRHCGQIQRAPRNARERDAGQLHAFDCEKRGTNDVENLIDCLYLYREFSSEALRILVPYTRSGVDEEAVQSFMAAVQLGLKKRFGGKVDHLRMLTQQEAGKDGAPGRQYVLLYDSVPGGTGYLHQLLANEAQTLVDVLRLALSHLSACACNADPEKDGCYRCVYQYRLGRAMASVSRDRARSILEHLVAGLDHLEKVPTVAEIYINPNFDSELEARFIEALRRLGGEAGLPFVKLVQDIVHGKSGYLLQVGEQQYWVEPQVDLGPTDGVIVPCRPDFMLWPVQSRSKRRPIAVFCDGWAYHHDTARVDAKKRNALVMSGKYWVWSATWEDVKTALDGSVETALAGMLEPMYYGGQETLSPPLRAMIDERFVSRNAVAVLIDWLGKPVGEALDEHSLRMARSAGATAFRMVPNPRVPELADARDELAKFWLNVGALPCDRPEKYVPCGNITQPEVRLRYLWPALLAGGSANGMPEKSPGFVILDDAFAHDEPARHLAWRRWLALFNHFQLLPGIMLATQDGLEAADHASLSMPASSNPASSSQGAALAAAWEQVLDQAMSELTPSLMDVVGAGVPPPDEVGFEYADPKNADTIIAEAELAWCAKKLVLLLPAHTNYQAVWKAHGWTSVVAEGEWTQRLISEIKEGTTA
ncbi:DUF1998 domain-containing protein [Aromatoleum aromaticum]|uniref:DUF1998 domain-containing protein n=1 Tax=Aromatoleum aromaticum TaxID=551760 RepID=UPI0012FE97F9|nr:DUF1998 domain-containing protein [Aromatoleum aromaticum]